MRKFVRFKAAFQTGARQAEVGEVVADRLAELKYLYPDIDETRVENMSHGHAAKAAAHYKIHVDGTIAFRPGLLPDWDRLNRVGEECFGFEDFKAVPMVRGFPGIASVEIHCRMCGRKVGEIKEQLPGATAGGNHGMEEQVDAFRTSHLAHQHPEVDPGLL
jgi:hypothetical protein